MDEAQQVTQFVQGVDPRLALGRKVALEPQHDLGLVAQTLGIFELVVGDRRVQCQAAARREALGACAYPKVDAVFSRLTHARTTWLGIVVLGEVDEVDVRGPLPRAHRRLHALDRSLDVFGVGLGVDAGRGHDPAEAPGQREFAARAPSGVEAVDGVRGGDRHRIIRVLTRARSLTERAMKRSQARVCHHLIAVDKPARSEGLGVTGDEVLVVELSEDPR